MKFLLNGKSRIADDNIVLSKLIKDSNLSPDNIIVQVDQEIVKKNLFNSYSLKENSIIEILAIVGGGWYEW